MSDKIRLFYEFEDFRLDPKNPSLWREEKIVSIPPKALELLILLVKRRGEIVSRDELLETVWKDTFVEEGNINYTISLLRKTLGNKDLIQTVPRRGYRFTADIKEIAQNGRPSPVVEMQTTEIPSILPQTNAAKTSNRWILVAILLVTITFLTGLAVWWENSTLTKASDNPQTQHSEAMQAYTRGKMIIGKKNADNREEKAIDEFQTAIRLDPTFALAYAGLAEAYTSAAVKFSNLQTLDNFAKAKTAAEKALALDANLAEGYLIRGWLKRNADWDWQGAETDLRRVIEIDPKNALAHQRLAHVLTPLGRFDEALAEVKIAYGLDPISDIVLGARFPILEARGDFDEALKESEQFLRENKDNFNAVRAYATFLYHKQDFAQVIQIGEETLSKTRVNNSFAWYSLLAASYYKTGQLEKSEEFLRQLDALSRTDSKAKYSLAMNYAEMERIDDAFVALQNCFDSHELRMVWLKVEPRFANLQNDSRFGELLQKMHLK